jgi:hypothetical protein
LAADSPAKVNDSFTSSDKSSIEPHNTMDLLISSDENFQVKKTTPLAAKR